MHFLYIRTIFLLQFCLFFSHSHISGFIHPRSWLKIFNHMNTFIQSIHQAIFPLAFPFFPLVFFILHNTLSLYQLIFIMMLFSVQIFLCICWIKCHNKLNYAFKTQCRQRLCYICTFASHSLLSKQASRQIISHFMHFINKISIRLYGMFVYSCHCRHFSTETNRLKQTNA